MPSYIIRRLLVAIPVLFGITIITFAIINSLPGSPVDYLVDPRLPAEVREAKLEMMGISGSVFQQYLNWLKNLLQGNLGYDLISNRPVLDVILERVGPTLLLMGSALVIGVIIAIPLGVVSAVKQYSALDYAATGLAFAGISMPTFFSGLALIYLFSVRLKLLPSGGMTTLGVGGAGDVLRHLIMPACVVAIGVVGQLIRYVRAGMLRELDQDYVRTAAAKGVKPRGRVFIHAFRNALLSIVTVIGMQIPTLFSGAVVAEQVFSWPGVGSLMSTAILSRNYPVLMGLILFSAVIVLLANLITDIVYAVVDPRIRLS